MRESYSNDLNAFIMLLRCYDTYVRYGQIYHSKYDYVKNKWKIIKRKKAKKISAVNYKIYSLIHTSRDII